MRYSKPGLPTVALLLLVAPAAAQEQQLHFSSEQSPGFTHALSYFRTDSGLEEIDVSVAEADVNDDGRNDVIAFAENSYYCGSGGCGPMLFLGSKKGGYRAAEIYYLSSPEANWRVAPSTTNGFHNIAVMSGDRSDNLVWNGEAYIVVED